jgi:hypothetical protein
MEILAQHHDLEALRAMLEGKAAGVLGNRAENTTPRIENP